ncbi:hypothetical protein DZC71_01450 [Campylobacter hepaticus]|uniref:Uncharacterized protein n=1 Tax=Campylobacter hepaticus TaxID=1813019 RepID=A0A424Z013_9BACT|nr:hypothetical protein DZC71_01450 [Campylobacter hepaticus]RQD87209.1 hypothetical protein DZD40_05090 [Campylobacter hepaticus]
MFFIQKNWLLLTLLRLLNFNKYQLIAYYIILFKEFIFKITVQFHYALDKNNIRQNIKKIYNIFYIKKNRNKLSIFKKVKFCIETCFTSLKINTQCFENSKNCYSLIQLRPCIVLVYKNYLIEWNK